MSTHSAAKNWRRFALSTGEAVRAFAVFLTIIMAGFAYSAEASPDAPTLIAEANALMREGTSQPYAVVHAAIKLTVALSLLRKGQDVQAITEAQSQLYWCRKKMGVDDIGLYQAALAKIKGQERSQEMAVVEKPKSNADAEAMFVAATEYEARTKDAFLRAVRWFEVAERFPRTPQGRQSQQKCLEAQQLMMDDIGAKLDGLK